MSHSNNIITAPISWNTYSGSTLDDDIITVLTGGAGAGSDLWKRLNTVCDNGNISQWARYKPTAGGCIHDRKKADGTKEKYSVLYGMAHYENGSLVGNQILKEITCVNGVDNWDGDLTWNLRPTLDYYRLRDFNGYKHNAQFGYNVTNFFAPTDLGLQHGIFYNQRRIILEMNSSRPPGLPFPSYSSNESSTDNMPQCWEDSVSGQRIDDYATLYLEDMLSTCTLDNITTFNIGKFKLGIAFRRKNNGIVESRRVLNTGYSIDDLITGEYGEHTIDVLSGSELIRNVGTIKIGTGLLGIEMQLSKLTGLILGDGDYDIRFVLIKTLDSATLYDEGFPDGSSLAPYHMYAFQPTGNFCKGTFRLKRGFAEIYVTEKTNLSRDLVRNNSRYFDNKEEYTYDNGVNGWDWQYTPATAHPEFKIQNKCKLTVDSSTKYHTENVDGHLVFVAGAGSAGNTFYRFVLNLGGFYCWEYRPMAIPTGKVPYAFIEEDPLEQNVVKDCEIQLAAPISLKNGNGAGDVYIQITNNSYPELIHGFDLEDYDEEELMEYSGRKIGFDIYDQQGGYSQRVWSYDNYASGGQLNWCTKAYGNDTGNWTYCDSQLIKIDHFEYTTKMGVSTSTNSTGNDIYIYVQTDGFSQPSSAKPYPAQDFYMKIKHAGIDTCTFLHDSSNAEDNDEIKVVAGSLPS